MTSRDVLCSLDSSAKILFRDGAWGWKRDEYLGKWRNLCNPKNGWIDCWSAPKVELQIEFDYHGVPVPGPAPQADVPTPEKVDRLLGPLRVPQPSEAPSSKFVDPATTLTNLDLDLLEADQCRVKLRVDESTAYLYGTLIRSFMHVKENLFGEDQQFTAMDLSDSAAFEAAYGGGAGSAKDHQLACFDPRLYRPIDVILDIALTNVHAHLLKHCSPEESSPCPLLIIDELTFEMDKKYRETRLQLQLSPVLLNCGNSLQVGQAKTSKTTGCGGATQISRGGLLMLTGLQFRGHAMFSEIDRPMGSDTLEYAWLMELQCGTLAGNVTATQLYNIFVALENFVFLALDKENVLRHPKPFKLCQHGENQKECVVLFASEKGETCPSVDDLKYKLVRFAGDSVDINIVERASALRLQACPVRFATCNLHGQQTRQGVTAIVNDVRLKQYVSSNFPLSRADFDPARQHPDIWIEAGSVSFGPVYIEGSLSGHGSSKIDAQQAQHIFLEKHDAKTKRLWFLWPPSSTGVEPDVAKNCGCLGGCSFFGENFNGKSFFNPSRSDIVKKRNVAIPCVRHRTQNPGFGQSILYESKCNAVDYRICSQLRGREEKVLPPRWPQFCRYVVRPWDDPV